MRRPAGSCERSGALVARKHQRIVEAHVRRETVDPERPHPIADSSTAIPFACMTGTAVTGFFVRAGLHQAFWPAPVNRRTFTPKLQ